MKTRLVASLAVAALLLPACLSSESQDPTGEPEPVAPLEDGEWFGMVTVGFADGDRVLAVDLAEMLTGQAAVDAAVEDGVIQPGEDLPNDFYIDNPENIMELLRLAENPDLRVLSSADTSNALEVSIDELADLYEGTHLDGANYYLTPLQPIPMNVTVTEGLISKAWMVYIP